SFVSDTLYLAPGRYRLKLVADNAVLWQSFTVRPFSESGAQEGSKLRLRIDESIPRALAVRAEARDAYTGRDLPYRLLVSHAGGWVSPASLPYGAITTGAVRQFRVESDGYKAQMFSLKIAADQDRLVLSAELEPEGLTP
ncbi:MAG TPA: serine/threonine protein kinase, partial [Spirochaetales bacterium]|nr:serine/threonine protein kinase [Spirochaetales bacterium]